MFERRCEMMLNNKKGLSDVVTTVMIILFALIAVVIVGSIVLNQVQKGGQQINQQSACLTNRIEILSCTTQTGAQGLTATRDYQKVVVSYHRISDSTVKPDAVTPTLLVTHVNGAVEGMDATPVVSTPPTTFTSTAATGVAPNGFATAVDVYTGAALKMTADEKVASASVTPQFTLTDGSTITCPVVTSPCGGN